MKELIIDQVIPFAFSAPYTKIIDLYDKTDADYFRLSFNLKGEITVEVYTSFDGDNWTLHSTHNISSSKYNTPLFEVFARYIKIEITGSGEYLYGEIIFFPRIALSSGDGSSVSKYIEYDVFLATEMRYDNGGDFAYYFIKAGNKVLAMLSRNSQITGAGLFVVYEGNLTIQVKGNIFPLSSSTPMIFTASFPDDNNYALITALSDVKIYAFKVFYQV